MRAHEFINEDTTMMYAAEKTPAQNPYGGLKDRKFRGDISEDEQLDELKCWPGYTRVRGVPAGAPGSCKKKSKKRSK